MTNLTSIAEYGFEVVARAPAVETSIMRQAFMRARNGIFAEMGTASRLWTTRTTFGSTGSIHTEIMIGGAQRCSLTVAIILNAENHEVRVSWVDRRVNMKSLTSDRVKVVGEHSKISTEKDAVAPVGFIEAIKASMHKAVKQVQAQVKGDRHYFDHLGLTEIISKWRAR